jgi:hypothetical protein
MNARTALTLTASLTAKTPALSGVAETEAHNQSAARVDQRGSRTSRALLLRCGPPGGRRFSITVRMDLKIAAVITAIGLGVSGGLAVAGVGAAAAPVGLR